MSASTIADLRAELDSVRALEADWKARGSPAQEAPVIRAMVAAAETKVASAIARAPADPSMPATPDPGVFVPGAAIKPPLPPPNQNDPWANTLPDAPAPSPVAHAHANKVADKRSKSKPPRSSQASRDVLNNETDARFWAQTHYKIGDKLDPNSAADRAYVKTWLDIFHKVEAEDSTGHLVTTYDHPEVAKLIADAKGARHAAEQHYEQAHDPWADEQAVDQSVKNAQAANKASKDAANKAASYQPPTVSPTVVQTSVDDAHRALGQKPPGSTVPGRGHPAWGQPGAHPSHPELATPSAANGTTSQASPSDKLGLVNTADAAGRAADAHANEEPQDPAAGDAIPKFPDKPDSGKKGLSIISKVAIGAGALAALAFGSYFAFFSGGSSRRAAPSRAPARRRATRRPAVRPSESWAPPTMPGRPGSMR